MQNKPSVMVVGVGAMGLLTGYHLSLAGADVAFLVRPARLAQLATPQILYCHSDRELKTFGAYRAISSIGEIDANSLDYVLVTLNGATSRTAEGSELLHSIGAALAGTSTQLLIGGVGVGLREHYLKTTGLPAIEKVADGSERPVVHSDRGGHYRWPGWLSRIADAKLIRSMSRKGYSPDNAACEGFFGRLKTELFYSRSWQSTDIEQFIQALDAYIRWYNEKRIKISLGARSPIEYRQSLGLAA